MRNSCFRRAPCFVLGLLLFLLAGCSTISGSYALGNSSGVSDGSSSDSLSPQADRQAQTDGLTEAAPGAAVLGFNVLAAEYSDRDVSGEYYDSVTNLTLADESVTISRAGTYVLSGSISDGQIIVDAAKTEKIQLVLAGVSISCSTGPAILIRAADKVFLTLAEGTENTLSDGSGYVLAAGEDEPNACVYSKADLTINGSGALSIAGNYNHGVYSKDDLTITGGQITVNAVNDALKGKDCVQILNGTFDLTAGGDGIQSNSTGDAARGYVVIDGGSFTIAAGCDGIQAETTLQVTGGTFSITTGGGSANASTRASGWGIWGPQQSAAAEETESAKGLKAGSCLLLLGGEFEIDSSDDALHSNGDMGIADGSFSIASGDDGAHADGALVIAGGALHISQSYEGLEGNSVIISGGDISLVSSDDGINAAGGSDSSTECHIRITGGTVYVNASGDGLDSNGSLYLEGGEVYVDGPTSNGDGALDYDSSAAVTGGTLVAVGSAGMAQGFGSSSTQYSFLCSLPAAVQGGTELTITDSAGQVLLRYTPQKSYQSVVFTSPALTEGGAYTVSAGAQATTVTLTSIAVNSGGMGGGRGGRGMGGGADGGGISPPLQEGTGRPGRDIPAPSGRDANGS